MTGTPPTVTLTADKTSYVAGETVTVAVVVTDADTRTEVVHGTNELGLPTVVTSATTDPPTISRATWQASGVPARVSGLTVTGVATYGAGAIEVTVRDVEGNETIASLPIEVRSPMLIGSDRSPIDTAVYPKLGYTRVYSPAGKGIKSLAGVPAGCVPHVSFKDQPTPVLVNGWLATLARPVILEWHHEPEGDMTIAAYRAGVEMLLNLVRVHPNGKFVKIAQTFTNYAQRHGKIGPDNLAATWKAMWCGADLIGFDCEVDHSMAGYPDPKVLFAAAVAASDALGVPFVVPELGWPQLATDTDGSGLAAWYTACLAYLRTVRCAAVAVYDTPQPPAATGDYLLRGKPLAAVQAAIR